MTVELGRIDLFVGERPVDHRWIAAEIFFEQVDASAVECPDRGIGVLHAVNCVHLEDRVLRFRLPAIGFEYYADGGDTVAVFVEHPRPGSKCEGSAGFAQRVSSSAESTVGRQRSSHIFVEQFGSFDLATAVPPDRGHAQNPSHPGRRAS